MVSFFFLFAHLFVKHFVNFSEMLIVIRARTKKKSFEILISFEKGIDARGRKKGGVIKSSVSRYHLPQKLGTARFNGFLTVYNATRNLFVMYLVLWIILTAFCCSKRTGLKEIVFLADITRRTIKLPSSSHHVTRDSPSPFEITSYEQRLIRGKKRKKGNDVALSKTLGQFRPHFVVISTTNETCVPIR